MQITSLASAAAAADDDDDDTVDDDSDIGAALTKHNSTSRLQHQR